MPHCCIVSYSRHIAIFNGPRMSTAVDADAAQTVIDGEEGVVK
jgi:hypothetical protein